MKSFAEQLKGLGYEVTQRLAQVVAKRLQATRVRLITASSQSAVSR